MQKLSVGGGCVPDRGKQHVQRPDTRWEGLEASPQQLGRGSPWSPCRAQERLEQEAVGASG